MVLLRKKTFLRLLLCIFTNRQKNTGSRPDAAGSMQAAAFRQLANSIHRRAFQPAKNRYSFGRQLFSFLLLYRAPHLPTASLLPSGVSRQTSHTAVQLFLQSKSQPSIFQHPSLSPISFNFYPFRPPTVQTFRIPFLY